MKIPKTAQMKKGHPQEADVGIRSSTLAKL